MRLLSYQCLMLGLLSDMDKFVVIFGVYYFLSGSSEHASFEKDPALSSEFDGVQGGLD